jgi:hypothetical protein
MNQWKSALIEKITIARYKHKAVPKCKGGVVLVRMSLEAFISSGNNLRPIFLSTWIALEGKFSSE